MKNNLKNKIMLPALCFVAAIIASSCSDWTEPESLGIKQPGFEQQNPELYARYLESLRNYKQSEHPVIYAWFDNVRKQPVTRAHHLSSVPDSVDVISLLSPDSLCAREIEEMRSVQKEKGTKVIFTFSYAKMEACYTLSDTSSVADKKTELSEDGFLEYMSAYADKQLALVDKYNYDGVAIWYDPKYTDHLEEPERLRERKRQEVFLTKIKEWVALNPDKMFVYEGTPQNLIDKTILDLSKYVVLRTFDVHTNYGLTYRVNMALREGVPADRFIVGVVPVSLDLTDDKTGYFTDEYGDQARAITEGAYWVASPSADFSKAGLGIYNIQDDYYNTSLVYKYTREAIHILNPSPKN